MGISRSTSVQTIVKVPQPKSFPTNNIIAKKEKVMPLKNKVSSPKETVQVKRGRGRPRKESTENIEKKQLSGQKTGKGKEKR